MDPKTFMPLVVAALVIWGIYRRTRRSFGRQRVDASRMWGRLAILAVVTGFVVVASAHEVHTLEGLLGGAACGAVLGYVGLRYTQFEVTSEGRFYTPHTYIGIAVMALFAGRILYRLLRLYGGALPGAPGGADFAAPSMAGPNPPGNYAAHLGPLTLAFFGALVGYYAVYYLGVLGRTRSPAVAEPASGAQ